MDSASREQRELLDGFEGLDCSTSASGRWLSLGGFSVWERDERRGRLSFDQTGEARDSARGDSSASAQRGTRKSAPTRSTGRPSRPSDDSYRRASS